MSIFGENPLAAVNTDTQTSGPDASGVAEPVATSVDTPAAPVVDDAGTPPAVAGDTGQPPAVPEPQYLSLDDYGDYLVKIKVDGEEMELPFKQVRDGLMRQEAFTKRTQELAEERRTLHQANAFIASMDANPADTLRRLAEAYDLDPSTGFQPVQREPEEQRLFDMQRSMAAQQQQLMQQLNQQRINNEIAALTQEYGEFDIEATAKFAVENGVDMTTAFKAMQFEELRKQQAQAAQAAVTRQQAVNAQVVHSGASTQRGAVSGAPAKVDSIRDAWKLTQQQLNL